MPDRDLLSRLDQHLARANELLEEIRREHELNRREHELNRREHELNRQQYRELHEKYRELHEITVGESRLNRAAIHETRSVTRELVAQLREDRGLLADIRQGIQANTEGLLRVLDELRRGDGPSPASA
jgi:hypothetical protein